MADVSGFDKINEAYERADAGERKRTVIYAVMGLALVAAAGLALYLYARSEVEKGDRFRAIVTRKTLATVEQACELYRSQFGSLPPEPAAEFHSTLKRAFDQRVFGVSLVPPLFEEGKIVDAWKRPIRNGRGVRKAGNVDLWSCGANGIDEMGDGDDIANWK